MTISTNYSYYFYQFLNLQIEVRLSSLPWCFNSSTIYTNNVNPANSVSEKSSFVPLEL